MRCTSYSWGEVFTLAIGYMVDCILILEGLDYLPNNVLGTLGGVVDGDKSEGSQRLSGSHVARLQGWCRPDVQDGRC
jgi:hypothetical protein